MPRFKLVALCAAVVTTLLHPTSSFAQPANAKAQKSEATVTLTESRGPIDNPERGFSVPVGLHGRALARIREERGATLVRIDGRLDAWRDKELPQSLLETVDGRLAEARGAGLKVVLRFMYNEGPYPNSAPDASLDWIKRHIAQLKPYLRKHADVIVWMEAGFIGAWGEWHTSTHGLDRDAAAKRVVLDALLDALPPSRSVLLRYPGDLAVFGDKVRSSRVGHHNDCFLASESDSGTYGRGDRSIAVEKALIASVARHAPIGGETCGLNRPRSDCPTALAELEQLGFSELNLGYHPGVLDSWRSGGCFETIRSRFGYRLWVEQVSVPRAVTAGRYAHINIKLRNSGFAAPLTQRPLYLVLDGPVRRTFKLPVDVRTWAPGKEQSIDLAAQVPAGLPPGTYTVGLWLPDEAASLRDDPRYAVRFANDGAWDDATGVNRLVNGIVVKPARKPQPEVAAKPMTPPPMGLGVKPR